MKSNVDLRLAELMAARLCHELAGAITAVASGVDLLGEPGLEVDREALELVSDSARRAAGRLQFYRFAYGFGGNGAAAGPASRELVAGFFEATGIVCDYGDGVAASLPVAQKLACNLVALGAEALVRGGHIAIDAGVWGFRLEARGDGVSLARERSAALALRLPVTDVTSRTVQAYFTGLLAQIHGWRLVDAQAPGVLYITSVRPER
jgi:histidine phosphotransferase ChpT